MKSPEQFDLEYAQRLIEKVAICLREYRKKCSRKKLQYVDHLLYLIEGNGYGGAMMYLRRLHKNLTEPPTEPPKAVETEKFKCGAPAVAGLPGTFGPYTGSI